MTTKKARQFDLNEMLASSKLIAEERCQKRRDETKEKERSEQKSNETTHSPSTSGSEDEMIGPPIPGHLTDEQKQSASKQVDNDEESEEEDLETLIESVIPLSHEAVLEHGMKPVSAIACDRNGARWSSGGYNYDVKLWDFGGMDSGLKPFRSLQPCECHVIKALSYSCTGDSLLVAAGSCQAKVLDRDGKELLECTKGDMYLVDPASTKGHTASLNSASFHPYIKNEFLTCADDGTLRLWCVDTAKKKHHAIIKTKTKQGIRAIPTTCAYSRDGKYIAAGCNDGSIQMWQYGKVYVNTALLCRTAHANGSDISCLSFSHDNNYLLSRSVDDTLKLWDMRKFSTAIHEKDGLDTYFNATDCIFSPRDEFCVTGTSNKKNEGSGRLIFFDKNTFETVKEIEYANKGILKLLWHPRINQLFVTLNDGTIKLYYDPVLSSRGALLCIKKPVKREKEVDVMAEPFIIAPAALPPRKVGRDGYVKESYTLRQMLRYVRLQQRPAHMRRQTAEAPMSGPGAGGRLGAAGGTLHSYVARQMGLARKLEDETGEDARSSILKHAEAAEKDPYWITPAYQKTQPKQVLASKVEEEEVDDELQPMFKKPKHS